MEITREMCERYRSNAAEIRELQHRLQHLTDNDALINNDTIFDYRTGYPRPQAVVGFDHDLYDKRRKRIGNRMGALAAENDNIEEFIFGIEDVTARRIFQLRYLEGYSQKRISRMMYMHQSTVSRKIEEYWKKN